jgi:hypothetical protein
MSRSACSVGSDEPGGRAGGDLRTKVAGNLRVERLTSFSIDHCRHGNILLLDSLCSIIRLDG